MRKSGMVTIDNYRYVTMGLLVISIVAIFFSLINVGEYGISVLRAMMPAGIDGSVLSPDTLWVFDKFKIVGIAFIVLPFIEGAIMVFAKDVYALIVGCASFVLNVIVGCFIMNVASDCVDSLLIFGAPARLNPVPVIIWVLLYVLLLAATGIILWQTLIRNENHDLFKEENVIIDDLTDHRNNTRSKWEFCGAVICLCGLHSGKAFAFNANENVAFGSSPEDEVQLANVPPGRTYCIVSYDPSKEEYHVEPLVRGCVLLGSGQPLGKGRIYCIPRDFELIVASKENHFKLA